jgi:hypothetical protein
MPEVVRQAVKLPADIERAFNRARRRRRCSRLDFWTGYVQALKDVRDQQAKHSWLIAEFNLVQLDRVEDEQ